MYALNLLNEWMLNEVQIVSNIRAASDGTRKIKDSLKKENSQLVVMYRTGDWERLDTTDDLKECMNNYHTAANCH